MSIYFLYHCLQRSGRSSVATRKPRLPWYRAGDGPHFVQTSGAGFKESSDRMIAAAGKSNGCSEKGVCKSRLNLKKGQREPAAAALRPG